MKPSKQLLILVLCLALSPVYAARAQSNIGEQRALFRIFVGDKTGFIDRLGNVVIEPQFYQADDFSEGLAGFEIKIDDEIIYNPPHPPDKVRDGAKFVKAGYIDESGRVAIPPSFWSAGNFSEGLASVSVMDFDSDVYKNAGGNNFYLDGPPTKSGYIDPSGKFVIEPQFSAAYPFYEGRAFVVTNDRKAGYHKWGYIDKTGKMIIGPFPFPPEHKSSGPDGWSRPTMLLWEFPDDFSKGLTRIIKDQKLAYIDRSGATVVETAFGVFGSSKFSEGLARFRIGGKYISPFGSVSKFDGKFGFIDRSGKVVIKPQFDIAGEFVEGLAPVAFKGNGEEVRWGFIDATGRMVIQPQFDDASNFAEGLSRVLYKGIWCFIDRTGKIVIETEFDYINDFRNGLARFTLDPSAKLEVNDDNLGKNVTTGYINTTGKIVWQDVR